MAVFVAQKEKAETERRVDGGGETHKERSRRVGKEIQKARRKVKLEWKRGRESGSECKRRERGGRVY